MDDIKKFFQQIGVLLGNIQEDANKYAKENNLDNDMFSAEYKEFFIDEYSKYFSFMDKHLSDENFIEELLKSIINDEYMDKEPVITIIGIMFPIEFKKIIYKGLKDNSVNINSIEVINKEDIDALLEVFTAKEILEKSIQIEPELVEYLVHKSRNENNELDKDLEEYIIKEQIHKCPSIVAEKIKNGDLSLIESYFARNSRNLSQLNKLLTEIVKQDIKDNGEILKKILLLNNEFSCISDLEVGKKLIDIFGSKALIFIKNPSKELVDKAKDFTYEDYLAYDGDYKKSPDILLSLLEKGHPEVLLHTTPEAIDDRVVEYIKEKNIGREYLINLYGETPATKSFAYNKYLASQNDYSHIYCIDNKYFDIDRFNFIYECVKNNEVPDRYNELLLIRQVLGKADSSEYSLGHIHMSKEVADKLVELGYTFEMYMNQGWSDDNLTEAFVQKGELRVLLIKDNELMIKYWDLITYELFLEAKQTIPNLKLSYDVAKKLVKEGHLDVLEYANKIDIKSIIEAADIKITSKEEFMKLPESVRNIPSIKEMFIEPTLEAHIDLLNEQLKNNDVSAKLLKKAVELGLPYTDYKKYADATRKIDASLIIKYLKDGIVDVIEDMDTYKSIGGTEEEKEEIIDLYYDLKQGDLSNIQYLNTALASGFTNKLIKNKQYSYLKGIRLSTESLDALLDSGYNIENFKTAPIDDYRVINNLTTEENIDEIIEVLEKEQIKISNGEEIIPRLQEKGISKENIKKLCKYLYCDLTKLINNIDEDDYDIVLFLDYEFGEKDSKALNMMIDKLSIEQIKELVDGKVSPSIGNVIISKMVNDNHFEFVKYYKSEGNEKTLKKALLNGYIPSNKEIKDSRFLYEKIFDMDYTEEEKKVLKEKLSESPRLILCLKDEIKEDPNILIEYIKKDPSIIEFSPSEVRKNPEVLLACAKDYPTIVAENFYDVDEENQLAIIKENKEIIDYINLRNVTENLIDEIVTISPQIIDREEITNHFLIEKAFASGYKISKKSNNSAIAYAVNNNIEVPIDIWDKENLEKILRMYLYENPSYSKHHDFYKKIFDKYISEDEEKFIVTAYKVLQGFDSKTEVILNEYGYRLADLMYMKPYETDENEEKYVLRMAKLHKLDDEHKKEEIESLVQDSNYRMRLIRWLYNNEMKDSSALYARKYYEENPKECIEYIEDEAKDDEFYEITTKLILENPEKNIEVILDNPELELAYRFDTKKLFENKEVLKVVVKKHPDIINLLDLEMLTPDILKEIDFEKYKFSDKTSIELIIKIIELDLIKEDNPNITNILDNIINNIDKIELTDKMLKYFIRNIETLPPQEFNKIYIILGTVDKEKLPPQIIELMNKGNEILEAYGKQNTLEINPVFSYDLIKYVYPCIGKEETVNVMKYNTGVANIITSIVKNNEIETANKYIRFLVKNNIIKQDDKFIHFALRDYEKLKDLILDIVDKNLTVEEIENFKKVLANGNRYKISTREELTHYEQIIDDYSKKMITEENISNVKDYLSTIFGYDDIRKLQTAYNNHQMGNFALIQYILSDIKKNKDKLNLTDEAIESLKYTEEEIKVILLMKEIIESNNIDELHKLIEVNINEDNKVFDYSDIVEGIIKKLRTIYNHQYNTKLTDVDTLESKKSEYTKTLSDGREIKVPIIDMNDESFHFLVHRLYCYDKNMKGVQGKLAEDSSLWDKLDGSSTLSTSSISDKGFHMLESDDNSGILYLFDEAVDGFMLYMHEFDLYIAHGGHNLEPESSHNSYTDIDSINQRSSESKHSYNEVAGYRQGMMPCAIGCVGKEPTEDQVKAAASLGVPIIRFDKAKYEEKKKQDYLEARERFHEHSNIDDLNKIMFNGLGISTDISIDECIRDIKESYTAKKITYEEMLNQLIELRKIVNRLSKAEDKSRVRKIEVLIQTIALMKNLTDEEMIDLEKANLGESGIMYKLNEDGKEYLVKPAVDKQELRPQGFRAEIQKAASILQKIISPETAVDVEVIGKDNLRISKQEKIELSEDKDILTTWVQQGGDLDSKLSSQLLKEYIVDFLLCNFDSFAGNFVIDSNGNIRGVDKEQSFRFIDDEASLDPSFSYTPNGLSRIPIYKILFERYNNGSIDLDFTSFDEAIKIIEEMSDTEYRSIFKDYADAMHSPELLDKIVERKHICIEKMKEYIEYIRNDKINIEGEVK